MRVIVTGASGVLGSVVYAQLQKDLNGKGVLGLANSRATGDLVKLNLLDEVAVENKFTEFKPDCMRLKLMDWYWNCTEYYLLCRHNPLCG